MPPTGQYASLTAERTGWPLRRKVPVSIFFGLLVLLTGWTWLAYRNVREAALHLASDRLNALTREFALSQENTVRERGPALTGAFSVPAVVSFLRSGGVEQYQATADRLDLAARQETIQEIALFSLDGTPLLASRPDSSSPRSTARHEELEQQFRWVLDTPDRPTVGNLQNINGEVVLPFVAPVLDGNRPVGIAVMWRRITATPTTVSQVATLLGAGAQIFFGDTESNVWSAFTAPSTPPPVPLPAPGDLVRYARPDSPAVVAAVTPVRGTPQVVLIEFSEASVLMPATEFLRQSIITSLGLLLIGTVLSWYLSRRITLPLTDLSEAAAAISEGDYRRRVSTRRRDEIGTLATAFNFMAERVAEARQDLERRIEERTGELRERNEELEAFAHSISHDLRAPLRAMHGFSQALLEDHAGQLDETGRGYAQRVVNGAARMDALIQDLLAYSKISRAEIVLAPVDAHAVAESVVSQLQSDGTVSDAVITIHDGIPSVLAHRAVLEQIVTNLMTNAIKFVPRGTRPEVVVRGEPDGETVRLWIEDNGIGIDAAHQRRIFDVFERLHSIDEYAGTGIGLAIVRKGTERMGGTVGVESQPGAGSRFWISLRRAPA